MENKIYDVVIIGAGPAGLTSALYAGRSNLSVLVIEKPNVGSLVMAHKIENYPGVLHSPTGKEIYVLMKEQVSKFNVDFVEATFLSLEASDENKIVKTDKDNFTGKTVIIASGWAKNGSKKLPGEEKYLGKGVSYCATCDGAFTRNMTVSLFGKGKEIAEEALFLTKYSKEIHMFITDDCDDKCDLTLMEALKANEKVKMYYSSQLIEIKGEEFVEEVLVKVNGVENTYKTQFAFLYLGTKSLKELYGGIAELDEQGYIVTNEFMETSTLGVYAAGDVRSKVVRQVTTATSDGTIAALEAIKHVLKKQHLKVQYS
ncbi:MULTISPECIES: NAD(P)/FAD-dependent oxidoreductase [Cetobacterium]|jgi:thioredoxin reductase (NADPH)|uniref:FAD-dependent oxidoreductase n=1 Tax=Candidatus Cetobacterium colombiensis TaxID=3073100 RepID=A0ABU4W7A9_9FUSO|nr:FAD-dependent oxidoreductase [Candidatus Cetobacterium colombiensis]MDX8335412.1 FAD-dependent oxidoreductase [Candidatus Cetobacterium colombiensis]